NEIAVGRVNFDAVKAGLLRAQCRRDMRSDGAVDPLLRHLLRNDDLERRLIHGVWDCRGRNRRLSADVAAGMSAAVAELDRGLRSHPMNGLDETREPGQKAVIIDSDLAPAVASGSLGRCHLNRDQADTAARPAGVI